MRRCPLVGVDLLTLVVIYKISNAALPESLMHTVRIYIDANIFIEMKDLRSLDWRALFPEVQEIHVVVSMHIVKELDKLKNDKSERRRKRSRAALQLIDDLSSLDQTVLRETPYRVTLELAFPRAHRWENYHLLDENDPDDRFVAHVLEDGDAILVSDDSGPRIKASRHGAKTLQPPQSFRLPPEETPDQKKIRELTHVIKIMEDKRPRMTLKLGCPSDPIVLTRPILGPMPEDLQADLVRRILQVNPKLKKPSESGTPMRLNSQRLQPVDWTRYEVAYATYVENVKRHAREIHHKLNTVPLALDVPFEIINAGRVTLVNADISIRLEGNGRLYVPEDEEPDEQTDDLDRFGLEFPDPPQLDASNAFPRIRFGAISSLQLPRIRYPGAVSFQWDIVPDDEDPRRANLSNKEFRVGKRHSDNIAIIPDGPLPLEVILSFELEARDLDEACRKDFKVTVVPIEKEWTLGDMARVEALLPEDVGAIG